MTVTVNNSMVRMQTQINYLLNFSGRYQFTFKTQFVRKKDAFFFKLVYTFLSSKCKTLTFSKITEA